MPPGLYLFFAGAAEVKETMIQEQLFVERKDYSNEKVLLGLSGGINSMAVLVWLASAPEELKPYELHLIYHHFEEHSPDTLDFVLAGVEYAEKHFKKVIYFQTQNSILEYFEKSKMIPHPSISPCTRVLKIEPMFEYMAKNEITVNVVGYVREELRRVRNMAAKTNSTVTDVRDKGVSIQFPIANFSDDWCFAVVKKALGWYPAIYDIRDERGNRVFPHNNCLPCKNMDVEDLRNIKRHFPEYFEKAHELTEKLNRQWGRNADAYYTEFGRPDYDKKVCETCAF